MIAIAEGVWRQRFRRWSGAALLGLALLAEPAGRSAQAQGSGAFFIPGDAQAGMQAFFDKGCSRCHAVLGEGGHSAPDLARSPAGHLSAAEMVAAMWNHAPAMWEKMRAERIAPAQISDSEMANLFAFLYSVRSWDEPGDAERGRQLLSEKRCLQCHAVAGQGGRAGPDLEKWANYRNPVSWVQAMWNHAPAMHSMMAARGLGWPQFRGNDVADLMAYVRAHAPVPKRRVYLRPGNAEAGRQLFRQKACAACHAVRGAGGGRAPDLGTRALPRTLGEFAGQMWNHAPAMRASMQARQIQPPQFSDQEMADLMAYLFAERFFEATGNKERGRRLFADKGCAGCHAVGGGPQPDPARPRASASLIPVATALWNHGPLMLEKMQQQQIPWPRFRSGEIVDLMEFLSGGRPLPPAAKGKP